MTKSISCIRYIMGTVEGAQRGDKLPRKNKDSFGGGQPPFQRMYASFTTL